MTYPRILGLILLAVSAFVSVAESKSALALKHIFSGPDFDLRALDQLSWHPDSRSFTFLRKSADQGAVALVEYTLATGREQIVLSSDQLMYQGNPIRISSYEWLPDRKRLLIGGAKSRTWDSVIEGRFFLYDPASRTVTALASGNAELRNVRLSPDGEHVGYVLENNIYITHIVTGETRAVTEDGDANIFNGIFDYGSTEFGFLDAWHWSPDSRRIAFWRLDATNVKTYWMIDELGKYPEVRPMKYPNTAEAHAVNQIGVYEIATRKTTWMDIGDQVDDYIPRIDWTPSSQVLSIQRLNRTHKQLDLLLADVRSGKSEVVVTDTDPAWIDITADLTFLAGGKQFVWTSEKSGYRHAYLYDFSGAEKQLTSGDWEIDSIIALDERDGWVYFYAKKDSFIDQHVYRVGLEGTQVERLTKDAGWYVWNMAPDARHVIQKHSDAATPPVYSLREPGGDEKAVLLKNELPGLTEFTVPNPEFFQFATSDGKMLNAYMIKPTDFDPNRQYPVIAYGYGNAGSQMVVNRWGSSRGAQRDLWHRYMAEQGFIVFSMDNRTTAGRGKQAKNLIYGHYAKWAVLDQLEGARYLKTLAYVDGDRLGFWGWSGGGYLTAAMMTKGAPFYKVGVSVAPVIDITRYQAVGVERWMGQLADNQAGYDAVNLINFVDRLQGDLLLIHGTGDENVKFAFTLQFADALIKAGKQFDMMVYPNEHHGIEGAREHVYTKIALYFEARL